MGNISPVKILFVVVIALVVLGPEKLPELTRKAGKAWGDFRRFRASVENQVRDVIGEVPGIGDLRSTWASTVSSTAATTPTAAAATVTTAPAAPTAATSSGTFPDQPATPVDATAPAPGWLAPARDGGRPAGRQSPATGPLYGPDDPGLN